MRDPYHPEALLADPRSIPIVRVSELFEALDAPPNPRRARELVEQSVLDRDAFFAEVFRHFASRSQRPPKSTPLERYDFYHDFIVRRVGESRVAMRWLDADRRWRAIGYDELHIVAGARAAAWARRGVAEGATVCLVLPIGPELLIALASAMRLGATISVLPPQGDLYLKKRLESLSPDHIVTDAIHARVIPADFAAKVLPDEIDEGEVSADSHTYPSGATFARLFSPLAAKPHEPIELTAGDAYMRAVRDAHVAFGLSDGDAIAGPGLHAVQHHPALLLAALAAGATFVHLTLEEVEENPALLAAHPLRSLGVSRDLRESILRGEAPSLKKSLEHWWRSPLEAGDLRGWDHLVKACSIEKVPGSNILIEASHGGARFVSARRPGGMHISVVPAPGDPWRLAELNKSGDTALGEVGLFTAAEAKESGPFIVARQRDEWYCVGSLEQRRAGRTYPREEVLAAIAGFDFFDGASIAVAPGNSADCPFLFVIVLFAGPRARAAIKEHRTDWENALREAIDRRLGPEFQPDRVEPFPLHVRRGKKGEVDHVWCQTMFGRGSLSRRSKADAFRLIGELRELVVLEGR